MNCRSACVVRGCTVSYANRPDGVVLFRFANDERLPRWVEAVKGKGSDWVPPKNTKICSLHFTPKDFWQNHPGKTKKVLLPGAIPLPAPQLPPASSILPKHLPNSTTYVYRKKGGAVAPSREPAALASSQQQSPSLASKTPVSRKTGVSVLRNIVNTMPRTLIHHHVKPCKTSAASPDSNSIPLPSESPASSMPAMVIPLTPPITPHTPVSNVFESSPSTSSTPTGSFPRALLNGSSDSVLPSSTPSLGKRGGFPPDISETPSKVMVQRGPPVPVCLDIEEDDSPRKIALKQMILHLENQLMEERKERLKEKKRADYYQNECDAMREIIKKVSQNLDSQDAVRIFKDQVSEDTYLVLERLAGNVNGEYCPRIRSFALTLHFYSPSGYEFVRQKLNNKLPCERTIRNWYSAVGGEPGFTEEALDTIRQLTKDQPNMPVVLIVDDMKLKKHIQMVNGLPVGAINYGGILDVHSRQECGDQVAEDEPDEDEPMVLDGELPPALEVEGEGEDGEDSSSLIAAAEKAVSHATDACVFMVVFLTLHLKLQIGYFLHAGLNSMMLAVLVRHGIRFLHQAGVTLTSLVSDGLPTNFAMVNRLGGDCRVRYHRLAGHPTSCGDHVNWKDYTSMFPDPDDPARLMAFIPDVCHMLKLVRNSLATWGTMIDGDGNTISWHYIQELANLQSEIGLKFANKLGRVHVEWCRQKMKTKFAAQTLSNSVADALEYLEFKVGLERFKGASATARFIRVFNNLFDVLNSRSKFGKNLKAPMSLRNESEWKNVFRESEKYIKGLKSNTGVAVVNSLREKGFRGFLLAIRAFEALFDKLVRYGPMEYLLTYKFSQDAIEMFFGLIRRMGGFNNNPTSVQFAAAYKRLLFKNELKASKNGNAFPIENIKVLSVKSKSTKRQRPSAILEDINWEEVDAYTRMYQRADHRLCSDMLVDSIVTYLAGFVARYVFRTCACLDCASVLISIDPSTSGDVHGFIQWKSGSPVQSKIHPTVDVVTICRLAERAVRCTQPTSVDIVKTARLRNAAAVHACNEALGSNVFKTLDTHVKELGPLDPHVVTLIKSIFLAYWDLRVHHLCREYNDVLQSGSLRQQYLKAIHFNNH